MNTFTYLITEAEDGRDVFVVADSIARALGEPTYAEKAAEIDAQREAEAE